MNLLPWGSVHREQQVPGFGFHSPGFCEFASGGISSWAVGVEVPSAFVGVECRLL